MVQSAAGCFQIMASFKLFSVIFINILIMRRQIISCETVVDCPRFDYEYKILEKLTKLDFQQMEMTETVRSQSELIQRQEKRIAELENMQSTGSVAFMATLSTTLSNPVAGLRVVFDDLITNRKGAYDSFTGVFMAPVDGVYQFNLIASVQDSPGEHQMHLFMMRKNTKIAYMFLDNNDKFWLQRSVSAIVYVNKGESVYVQISQVYGISYLNGGILHTHFSGFLIQ